VEIFRAIIPSFSSESGPTPKDLVIAIDLINKHNIPVIFIENETNDKSGERVVEETSIKLVKGLSVETLRDGQTYIDFMKYNIAIIVSNLVD
jgi:ABC-type Zn uptake system ZnuABC Zn-binding protein ZnuA